MSKKAQATWIIKAGTKTVLKRTVPLVVGESKPDKKGKRKSGKGKDAA